MFYSFAPVVLLYVIGFILSLKKMLAEEINNHHAKLDLDFLFYAGAIIIAIVQFSLIPPPMIGFFVLSVFCFFSSFYSWKKSYYYQAKSLIYKNNKTEKKATQLDGLTFFLLNASFFFLLLQYIKLYLS